MSDVIGKQCFKVPAEHELQGTGAAVQAARHPLKFANSTKSISQHV